VTSHLRYMDFRHSVSHIQSYKIEAGALSKIQEFPKARCPYERSSRFPYHDPAPTAGRIAALRILRRKAVQEACPVNCSPFDFIMAARVGNPSDIRRSAAEILQANPLGGVCGMVCPDTFCMAACSRKNSMGRSISQRCKPPWSKWPSRMAAFRNFQNRH